MVRSIDLGVEERINTYADLETFAQPGNPFALAKAAFALAGFLPRFHAGGGFASLAAQLAEFGGGIEISLVAAAPKGSGLGTSSILAASVLAALGDLCGLGLGSKRPVRPHAGAGANADHRRRLAGPGRRHLWRHQTHRDRARPGAKADPPLAARPIVRPQLRQPVHSSLLHRHYAPGQEHPGRNRARPVPELPGAAWRPSREIGANASFAGAAIQKCDYEMLLSAMRTSWQLNQRLDSGTNPPEVQAYLDRRSSDHLAAAKLLGAGGGGYLLSSPATKPPPPESNKPLPPGPQLPRPFRGFYPLRNRPASHAQLSFMSPSSWSGRHQFDLDFSPQRTSGLAERGDRQGRIGGVEQPVHGGTAGLHARGHFRCSGGL